LIEKIESEQQNKEYNAKEDTEPRPTFSQAEEVQTPKSDDPHDPQKKLVDRVLQCKDYYEMLQIKRDASTAEIKTAYKKLALQLHPDKNQASRAEEAFKAVAQAFSCLSSEEKRKRYDMFGRDGEQDGLQYRYRRSSRASYPSSTFYYTSFDDDDISPEELFHMFFSMHNPHMQMRQRRTGRSGAVPRPQAAGFPPVRHNGGSLVGLLQLLPLFLLLILALFSNMGRDNFPYRLEQMGEYTVHRKTTKLGVDYYVKDSFAQDLSPSEQREIDADVEKRWLRHLKETCHLQKQHQQNLLYQARWSSAAVRQEILEKPLTACVTLKELQQKTDVKL